MVTTSLSRDYPAEMYPAEHAGACYDRIGVLATLGGVATGPLLAGAVTTVDALVDGTWPLSVADILPDVATAAAAGGVLAMLGPALLLYRHWRAHRALALAEADVDRELASAMLAAATGDLDRATFVELASAAGFGDVVDELLARIDEATPAAAPDAPVELAEEVLAA
jgi:hypothetical protein